MWTSTRTVGEYAKHTRELQNIGAANVTEELTVSPVTPPDSVNATQAPLQDDVISADTAINVDASDTARCDRDIHPPVCFERPCTLH
jgi:hypothetical protein